MNDSAQILWQNVLLNAVTDALEGVRGDSGDRSERIAAINAAREYLTEPNDDCDMVCAMAGIEADALRRRIGFLLIDAADPEDLITTKQNAASDNEMKLTLKGVTKTTNGWADHLGIRRNLITNRLRTGCTVEEALAPKKRRGRPPKQPSGVCSNFLETRETGVCATAQEI